MPALSRSHASRAVSTMSGSRASSSSMPSHRCVVVALRVALVVLEMPEDQVLHAADELLFFEAVAHLDRVQLLRVAEPVAARAWM